MVGWCEEGDHLLASGGGFRRLMPASDLPTRTTRRAGVFLLYHTYLWNKQQVMSINLTTWSTMQYHVVVDHVVFNVIYCQVRYNTIVDSLELQQSCAKSSSLQWRHNERHGVSNHQRHDCLLDCLSKYQSSASLTFVRGIHRWPVNSPHKRPVTRKMFPFDDVIMLVAQRVD